MSNQSSKGISFIYFQLNDININFKVYYFGSDTYRPIEETETKEDGKQY